MTSPTEIGISPAGHRLPAATRPGKVHLQVADLDRSLDWYQHVLGLRVAARESGEATLADRAGRATLVRLRERPGATPVPPHGRLGLYHVALLLPERAALGAFMRHLAELGERVGAADHLVSEALYLHDPDGLGFEVYADRPRTTWQYETLEIRMDTLPLDQPALARAAGATSWTGTPEGTTVGHVHLHVGDLTPAEAFYHHGLGLDKVVWSYPGALFLSAGGYHHHLGLNTWAAGAEPARESDARLLDWELLVPSADDVHAAARSLRQAGYPVDVVGDAARARDPWGTVVRIAAGPAPGARGPGGARPGAGKRPDGGSPS